MAWIFLKGGERLLNNYDELCFKGTVYPLAISLDDLADDFARLDCKDNKQTAEKLLQMLERLEGINIEAHRRIYDLLNGYGYRLLLPKE